MTVYFRGSQILFNSGSVAMNEACCCNECDCTGAITAVGCTSCLGTDYGRTLSTPRDFEFSISGVTDGTTTGCTGSDCASYVATHKEFFNGTFSVTRCTTVTYQECISLGCEYTDTLSGFKYALLEYNRLALTSGFSVGNWTGQAQLISWVVYANVNALNPNGCANIHNNPDGLGIVVSKREWFYIFSRSSGTRPTYQYDPTPCPPESCTNNVVNLFACVPAAWSVTATSNSGTQTTCKKALDVTAATVTLTSV